MIKCKGIVKGVAEGEALVCRKSFSFLGDIDMDTGEIIARGHEHQGKTIAGKILIFPESKGSSGGCVVLRVLAAQQKAPKALVNLKMVDYNLVEGAILAKIPFVCKPDPSGLEKIQTGDRVRVDGNKGTIQLITSAIG